MADKEMEKLIPAETADALIAAHDGDMALYCLYAARFPGADDETAAAALCRTRGEIAAAREKLGRLVRRSVPVPPADEPVEFDSGEIVRTFARPGFEAIQAELERILGKTPSRAYLNVMVDIYDRLGMPPDVILLLLNYCAAEAKRLWGRERSPSAKFISDEAYRWAGRELMTMELAEEYIARRERQREDNRRIAAFFGIRDRELGQTESAYIESWREMGFSDEAIALAYDRTLTNTGKLKWAYLNGILLKWHAAGLHGLDEIERAEGRRRSAAKAGGAPAQEADPQELERILNKLRGGRS